MTIIDRNWLLLGITLTTMVFVAAAFAGADPVATGLWLFVVVLAAEPIVYFIATLAMNPRATIGMAAGTAVVLTMLRAVCSLGGGILYNIFASPDLSSTFIYSWVNPFVLIIQAIVLVMAGPYLMAMMVPELVGAREAARLLAEAPPPEPTAGRGAPLSTQPTGGFIQVFSFQELAAVIKKSHGIEGFFIVSNEGLIVWKDLPLRVNSDVLAARLQSQSQAMGTMVERAGLTKVRRVMVESREHFLFTSPLDQNFSLVLFFNGRVAPEEILSRIAIIAKSSREFLHWKYPSLPRKAGVPKDVALELA